MAAALVVGAVLPAAAIPAAAMPAAAAPAGAGTVPLPVEAVLTNGDRTTVVVDLSASTHPGPRTAEVTVDGTRRRADVVPLMSAGLAVTIVVDSSAVDAATLPAWLSAGARFILEAPAGTRATVIGDSAPAATIVGAQEDPAGIVTALQDVRPHGKRDTAAALALAARQFPEVTAGRKLTVVYTGAADAGGFSANELAARFRAAGMLLVVATTADTSPYWTAAAEATGGFFAPAGHPVVVPALDQVETTLRGRYLIGFRTPARRPAAVPLRVTTPDLTLAADVTLPAPPAARPAGFRRWALIAGLAALGVALLAVVVRMGVGQARRRRRPPPIVIAHGRASVPGSLPRREP